MLVKTKASALEFDDAKLGPPITVSIIEAAALLRRPIRARLHFLVEPTQIRCLECNITAKTFDALLPLAFNAITLNKKPAVPSSNALWRAFFAAPYLLTEPEIFTRPPRRRILIGIRGDVNFARTI